MAKTKKQRGVLSADLADALSRLASQGQSIFTVRDFAQTVERPLSRVWRTMTFLVGRGWIIRLVKGTYLIVPLEAGPESAWSEDSLLIGSRLATPAAVSYWSACNYWSWTEQVARTVFVQTTHKVSGPQSRIVLGVGYRFIRIQPRKFFGVIQRQFERGQASITDPEKTLVDCLDHPELCGGIGQVVEMLPGIENLDWAKVDKYLKRLDSGAAYKRLGLLVEHLGDKLSLPDREKRLERWRANLTGGYAPLEPGGQSRGPVNNRWLVRLNVPGLLREGVKR